MVRKIVQLSAALAASAASVSVPAFAHPGLHHAASFASGFAHPLAGWDHLLAMLAVGLWASQQRRATAIALPLAFPIVMLLGALAAVAAPGLAGAEAGIAGSVLVLGLLVAFAVKLPAWGGLPVIALFAAAHGYAHGLEMPAGSALYVAGFLAATVFLHSTGLAAGRVLRSGASSPLVRVLGAGTAAAGAFLLAAV